MDNQTLMIGCIVGAAAMVGYFVMRLLMTRDDEKLRDRLNSKPAEVSDGKPSGRAVKDVLQQIGQAAAKPFMPSTREKQSALRRNLAYAGIYSPSALKVMTGFKVILLVAGVLGGYLAGAAAQNPLFGVSVGGLLGYLAPTIWLKLQIKSNQKLLNYALPDALDLMVVCVEAGLTVDAALQRVGQELVMAHPLLSRELAIAHMETNVGLSRSEALRNLGTRTGNSELQSLAAMLIQADRFGTSIAQSLRIHGDALRTKRHHEAEEKAAKASVKMSFPLVLFIFPATFIVLAGPTILQLIRSPLF